MKQTISHIKVSKDGVEEQFIELKIIDKKYSKSYTEVSISIENALDLRNLLEDKLSSIPL